MFGGIKDHLFGNIARLIFLSTVLTVGYFYLGEFDRYSIRKDLVSVSRGAGKLSNFPVETGQIGESFFVMGHYGLDTRPGFEDRKRAYLEQVMPESLVTDGELYIAGYRSYLSNARIWAEWQMISDPQELGILPLREYWVLSVGGGSLDSDDCRTLASMEFPGLRGLQIIPSRLTINYFVPTFDQNTDPYYISDGSLEHRVLLQDNLNDAEVFAFYDILYFYQENIGQFPISGYSNAALCGSDDQRYTWNLRGSHSRSENCIGSLSAIGLDNVDLACEGGNASVVYAFLGDQK